MAQLRFHLATGRWRPGELLPSTRELGRQLGISFHTVRKAYQELEHEGLLEAQAGRGYVVLERVPAPSADRLERGAAVVQEALHRLVGLGLDDEEVEYLVQEQLAYLSRSGERLALVFAAPWRELAETCAEQLSAAVQERVEAVRLAELARHLHADLVVTPHASLHEAEQALPRADVVSVLVHPASEAVARAARLLPGHTLGLVTRHADAVAPILQELRHHAGFAGAALALEADTERERLEDFVREVDLLLFTPQARRRLRPFLEGVPHAQLDYVLDTASLEEVRRAVRR